MENVNNCNIYCQRVLPLAYDESLSYYEVLCKLTEKMNELIDSINNNFDDIVHAKVNEILENAFVSTIYDEENSKIILKIEV